MGVIEGTIYEPTIIGAIKGDTRRLDSGSYRDDGKEDGHYYGILGLDRARWGLGRSTGITVGIYYIWVHQEFRVRVLGRV